MLKRFKLYIITVTILISGVVTAGLISRFTTFTDGQVLIAAQLNGEFNQLVNLVNGNLDNDNISSSAALSPAKVSASIAGDGLSRDGSTGVLSVNVDDVTLDTSSDAVIVKTNGVGNSQLRQSAALSVIGNSTNATANVADIVAASDAQVLRRSGTTVGFGTVATAGIADGAITQAKRADLGQQVASSSGSYSGTSSGLTQITNQQVTITTTGRPVMLMMVSDATIDTLAPGADFGHVTCNRSGNESVCAIAFLRGVSIISYFGMSSDGGSATTGYQRSTCSSFQYFDVPSAGTYTYSVQIRRFAAGTSYTVTNCHLVAYEL